MDSDFVEVQLHKWIDYKNHKLVRVEVEKVQRNRIPAVNHSSLSIHQIQIQLMYYLKGLPLHLLRKLVNRQIRKRLVQIEAVVVEVRLCPVSRNCRSTRLVDR